MKKRRMLQIIMIASIIGLICCVGILVYYYTNLHKQKQKYEQLAEIVMEEQTEEETQTNTEVEVEEVYVSPIDFDKLQTEQNEDIYAWIKLEGTKIDYPVLQHPEDDTYYLVHNIDGSYGYPGCIFSELYNRKDFTDPVTVLYGHYMKDGSMFAALHDYTDREFFEQHEDLTIYTPDEEINYKIFASCYTDNKRLLVWYNFYDKEILQQYLDEIYAQGESDKNHIRDDIEVSADDQFIILETCVDESEDQRYIIIGVR